MRTIRMVTSAEEMDSVRVLFREYVDEFAYCPGAEVWFEGFDHELAKLPGEYGPPSGCLLLASVEGVPAGCVALKKAGDGVVEMKRLFVRRRYRGTGLGRTLARRVIEEARRLGYEAIRLDTDPAVVTGAVKLYRSLGFREISAYDFSPIPGTLYMELRLEPT